MSKIYFPKDEKELFSVARSNDGLVIPLVNFGYPNMHATVFLREIEKDLLLFNVHIKYDISEKMIVSKSIKFNPKILKNQLNEKIKKLREVCFYYFKKWDKQKVNTKDFVCLDCFIKKKMLSLPPINKRKNAQKFYESLPKLIEDRDILSYPICNKPKHSFLYNIKKDEIYYRIANHIITQKESDEYVFSMESVFKEEFEKFSKFLDSIIKDFHKYIKT